MDAEKELPKIYSCRKVFEPVCQPPCEDKDTTKYDPKSYCFNILSKTKKVCKKSICRRFLRTNVEKTKGDIVCIPRPPCKLKRFFGPVEEGEDEDDDEVFFRMYGSKLGLVLDQGTVSETDILKGKFERAVSKDGRDSKGGYMSKFGYVQDEETAKFLEDLSKYLDPEGMAALAALGGAELCPCCKCTLCRCKLRGVTSEMLLAARQRALMEKRLKDWGKLGYAWSFDYFYNPDFEYFKKEREERIAREQAEAEERESQIIMEEMAKKGFYEESIGETSMRESSIQASPPTSEKASMVSARMLMDMFPGDAADLPSLKEPIPTIFEPPITLEVDKEDQYVRGSLAKSSIESWVEFREPLPEGRRPTTISEASKEPLDITYPEAEIRGSIRLPPETAPVETKKLESFEEISGSVQWKTIGWGGELKHKPKKDGTPSLISSMKSYTSKDEGTDVIIKRGVRIASVEGSAEDVSAEASEVSRKSGDSLMSFQKRQAFEEAKAKAEALAEDLPPSKRLYADTCDCLPGFCVCGEHFTFKGRKDQADFGGFIKPTTDDKEASADEDLLSADSSCVCIHPWDEIDDRLQVTPEMSVHYDYLSETPKKIICKKPPKYQKTLVIVKPEAMKFKDVILRAIQNKGLHVIAERTLRLSPEQAAEIYSENYGSAYFALFVQRMSASPILVLCVAGLHAVEEWKSLVGEEEIIPSSWFFPESIKRRFGIYTDIFCAMKISNDTESAKTELRYFFPLDILDPIIIENARVQDYCDKYIHPTLLTGLHKIAKDRPKDPLLVLAEWILKNNPFQPIYPDAAVALSPT